MSDIMTADRKKPSQKSAPKPQPKAKDGIPDSGAYQFPLRFADSGLARAVLGSAERNRRSMNQEILFILEAAMRAAGRLPEEED